MRIALTLPQLGLTQTEGSVSEWLKAPGDAVKKDEIIFVVSTDKAEMEIESPADGVMGEILIKPGVTVDVGTPLAWLEKEGDETDISPVVQPEQAQKPLTNAKSEDPAAVVPESSISDGGGRSRLAASPRARRLARELGVDISRLRGSGPEGRIVEADVRAAENSGDLHPPSVGPVVVSPGNRHRQIIARRMTESIQTIPAFSLSLEVNAANLVELYTSIGDRFARSAGMKLSYTDLLVKCVALALQASPELNAVWSEETPAPKSSIDLNLAVGTDSGVAAPIMRSLESASLQQIAGARTTLAKKAREGHLSLADLENGIGTLSNLGMYKVDSFRGIITPGQSFIVSIGCLAPRPWINADHLTIQPTIHLTLSVDHRVADGVQAAKFLEHIAELVETPSSMELEIK